jgi:PIN domain nuclease of toxin-antitoxin system
MTNERILSIACLWDIAIKIRTGKLTPLAPYDEAVIRELMTQNQIMLLDIKVSHTAVIATLPLHHRDPFDRMLIAQSLVDGIPILSADPMFDLYGVERNW